jgi:peptide chain release factor subunit 1
LEGDRIADLRSRRGSLISLYAGRPSPGGFAALLSDLTKPIRDEAASLDRAVQKSVRSDVERIHDLADQIELDSAPGYAIFASDLDGIFVLEALSHPVPDMSALGPRPYMRPLRATPRALRSGVIVADRSTARTFTAVEGVVEEIGETLHRDLGNRSWGGFSGYEEHTVRSRAEEVTSKLWRDAGERLLEKHVEKPFDYLAIGSHEETVEEIARTLHPYLAQLQRGTFTINPQSVTLTALRTELSAMDEHMRESRQAALAGRVCDTAWSGGNALLGLQEALDAANTQAIDTLVVAGPFSRPGVICDACGYLARDGEICPVCGQLLFAVDDVVGALMESTVAAGGTVSQIGVASPLDRHGVGALTRFPVAVGA